MSYLVRADHERLWRETDAVSRFRSQSMTARRFVRTLAWRGFRRPRRLLRWRLVLRTGWFRRAPWRGCLSSRLASFGKGMGQGTLERGPPAGHGIVTHRELRLVLSAVRVVWLVVGPP